MFILILATSLLVQDAPHHGGHPRARVSPDRVEVGTVLQTDTVEQDFVLRNEGDAPLQIEAAELTSALQVDRFSAAIPPGASATIHVRLGTATVGAFEEEVRLRLNDPVLSQVTLTLRGEVVPPVQVLPRPAVGLVGQRGARTQTSVDIVNHSAAPMRAVSVDVPTDRVFAELVAVDPGRRYRLTLTLDNRGAAGKELVPIVVHTDSPTTPVVRVLAVTFLRERVYTFPDAVDLGALPKTAWTTGLAQTLMVYQTGGSDFEVTFSTDVPGLAIRAERGRASDRWQATLALDPSAIQVGTIHGSVIIHTNDPDFPTLAVPVTGEVLEGP
jgi:hypothetical protein